MQSNPGMDLLRHDCRLTASYGTMSYKGSHNNEVISAAKDLFDKGIILSKMKEQLVIDQNGFEMLEQEDSTKNPDHFQLAKHFLVVIEKMV